MHLMHLSDRAMNTSCQRLCFLYHDRSRRRQKLEQDRTRITKTQEIKTEFPVFCNSCGANRRISDSTSKSVIHPGATVHLTDPC
jgi:Fe-S-cluster-containing hydrogenase component 2